MHPSFDTSKTLRLQQNFGKGGDFVERFKVGQQFICRINGKRLVGPETQSKLGKKQPMSHPMVGDHGPAAAFPADSISDPASRGLEEMDMAGKFVKRLG